jgi:molybdopterin converting factor small subunit
MQFRVLFFGATADETGKRFVELPADPGMTAQDAVENVLSTFPQLRKHKLLFAANQEYVPGSHALRDGDELAIFTAVSGG